MFRGGRGRCNNNVGKMLEVAVAPLQIRRILADSFLGVPAFGDVNNLADLVFWPAGRVANQRRVPLYVDDLSLLVEKAQLLLRGRAWSCLEASGASSKWTISFQVIRSNSASV